jgi:hypothetical protein
MLYAVILPISPPLQRSIVATFPVSMRHFLNWMRRTPQGILILPRPALSRPCRSVRGSINGQAAIARFRFKRLDRRPWTVI